VRAGRVLDADALVSSILPIYRDDSIISLDESHGRPYIHRRTT